MDCIKNILDLVAFVRSGDLLTNWPEGCKLIGHVFLCIGDAADGTPTYSAINVADYDLEACCQFLETELAVEPEALGENLLSPMVIAIVTRMILLLLEKLR